jgi:hypothetical protein
VAGFANHRALTDAQTEGRTWYSTFRKRPVTATSAGFWFDLSLAPGNPSPQYYAATPLRGTPLSQSADGGIYHGPNVAPATKHLRGLTLMANSAAPLPLAGVLCDMLLYYPFLDEGSTDPQVLDNTTPIPRYTTGVGVQIMAISLGARTGGSDVAVTYTNSAGVSGRTATFRENSPGSQPNGMILTHTLNAQTNTGLFVALQTGDTGVRSIESVTMLAPDVGLFALVLVRPLAQTQVRGIDAPVEIDYWLHHGQAPRIFDDAHLALIVNGVANINAVQFDGDITVAWN